MTATLERALPLIDLTVRSEGAGRDIVAYAAMFDDPYEVHDYEGHYFEQISRSAFNRTLSQFAQRGGAPVALFNHGKTADMTPSERYTMPFGTPVEVKAETRGLLTVTRCANTPLGDEVLEVVRSGAVTGMSFRGPIVKDRTVGSRDGLRLVERTDLGLRDYGPCTFPVNATASILAVRAVTSNELTDKLNVAVRDRFATDSDTWPYIDDFSFDETWIVYSLDGHYYRISYTIADDGAVALEGDPREVERDIAYTEISTPAASTERSTPPVTNPTASPAGDPAGPDAAASITERLRLEHEQRKRKLR